jgi:hypothetical protein
VEGQKHRQGAGFKDSDEVGEDRDEDAGDKGVVPEVSCAKRF